MKRLNVRVFLRKYGHYGQLRLVTEFCYPAKDRYELAQVGDEETIVTVFLLPPLAAQENTSSVIN